MRVKHVLLCGNEGGLLLVRGYEGGLSLFCVYEGGMLLVRGYEGGPCRVLLIERRLGSCTTESKQVWELCFWAEGRLGTLFPEPKKAWELFLWAKGSLGTL